MIKWLQYNKYASFLLLFLRLYLGFQWLVNGMTKFSKGFDATGYLKTVINNPVKNQIGEVEYPLYISFLKNLILPLGHIINVLIPTLEVTIGILLILGLLSSVAAFIGVSLNFFFLFAGTVSVNPVFIIIGLFIFIGGFNSGVYGLDKFLGKHLNFKVLKFFNYEP